MLVAEPTPIVFDEKYSVLGKSKKKFMAGRFSPVSKKCKLQLVVNLAFSKFSSEHMRLYLPDTWGLMKFWIHVRSYWRVLGLKFEFFCFWPFLSVTSPMSSTASRPIYAGKKFVIHIHKYCHSFKPNNCERLHTTTAIMMAVCECKISIVNKKNNFRFDCQPKPYMEFWRPLSFIILTILLEFFKNSPIR